MSGKQLLAVDDRDTRQEVYVLLSKIPAARRLAWLRWACASVTLAGSKQSPVVPPTHSGNAMEVYLDSWALVNDYHLDPAASLKKLEEVVRRYRPSCHRRTS